jgi:aldose 1-epimerase
MQVETFQFGKTKNGKEVKGVRLLNDFGLKAEILNWGGTLKSFEAPDKNGISEEITLTFDNFRDFEDSSPYFGSTIGRVANRINKGEFEIDGSSYKLTRNENNLHHLHGGEVGFDKVIWEMSHSKTENQSSVTLRYVSIDGEEGYPGNLIATVTYILTNQNELIIDYEATLDKPCPVNLTNHTYWNLSGNSKKSILDHKLELNCDTYLPVDETLIPSGELAPVKDSAWDFTTPKTIGQDIEQAGDYDHCFVISKNNSSNNKYFARLHDPVSGRRMTITTTEPSVQFYSGNFLGTGKVAYIKKYSGLCLETQRYPNAINQSQFPSIKIKPGDIYHQRTVHKFDVE